MAVTKAWQLEGIPVGEGNEVANSLADKVNDAKGNTAIVEQHFHGRARWFGKLAAQTATDWADDTLAPYQAISGNNAYGSDPNDEAQVLGSADTPVIAGMTLYDLHRFMIIGASSATVYKLRMVWGTGTMADAITAGQYSETVLMVDPAVQQVPHDVFTIMMLRVAAGTQLWVQVWNATDNATIDFLVGLHEYVV